MKKIDRERIIKELKSVEKRNITFSLPEKMLESFKKDCDKNEVSMNQVIQKLIEEYLK